MKIIPTNIPGVILLQPQVFEDARGHFFESFHQKKMADAGILSEFAQENQSLSHKGVLRGLHFQYPPHAQGKLVRVVKGAVTDVVVDIRTKSSTYGKFIKVELSETNKWMCWIPAGFAHGFLALEDYTIFHYKCTAYYQKEAEGCLRWNDPDLNIPWGIDNPIISEKDQEGVYFKNFISRF